MLEQWPQLIAKAWKEHQDRVSYIDRPFWVPVDSPPPMRVLDTTRVRLFGIPGDILVRITYPGHEPDLRDLLARSFTMGDVPERPYERGARVADLIVDDSKLRAIDKRDNEGWPVIDSRGRVVGHADTREKAREAARTGNVDALNGNPEDSLVEWRYYRQNKDGERELMYQTTLPRGIFPSTPSYLPPGTYVVDTEGRTPPLPEPPQPPSTEDEWRANNE